MVHVRLEWQVVFILMQSCNNHAATHASNDDVTTESASRIVVRIEFGCVVIMQ